MKEINNGMNCDLCNVHIMDCLCHATCVCGESEIDKRAMDNGNVYYICRKCNMCRGGTCCGKQEKKTE